MELDNRGLFEMEPPELQLNRSDVKWLWAGCVGFAIFAVVFTAMHYHFGSEAQAQEVQSTAVEDRKPPVRKNVVSGIIEDVEIFRANDNDCVVLVKFQDGRLLKAWSPNYNYTRIFHIGKYNNVVLDVNGNGGIADVEYVPGITD